MFDGVKKNVACEKVCFFKTLAWKGMFSPMYARDVEDTGWFSVVPRNCYPYHNITSFISAPSMDTRIWALMNTALNGVYVFGSVKLVSFGRNKWGLKRFPSAALDYSSQSLTWLWSWGKVLLIKFPAGVRIHYHPWLYWKDGSSLGVSWILLDFLSPGYCKMILDYGEQLTWGLPHQIIIHWAPKQYQRIHPKQTIHHPYWKQIREA